MRSSPLASALFALLLVGCPRPVPGNDAGPGGVFENPVSFDDEMVRAMDPSTLPQSPAACREPALARVYNVRDGDTVDVRGEIIVLDAGLRMIGVDTPETVGTTECYGPEAHTFTDQLNGRLVWLTFDEECFDRFDRLLGYVHVGPGEGGMWQRQLLRRGLARVFTFVPNDEFATTFESDQASAIAANKGLWPACP
jgi:endonuclease YncB( thermonuclease family)